MIGRVLAGKYRVIELIGAGGMAEVYRASQVLGPHRTVAVKVLKNEFRADAAFLHRFEQEAAAALTLSHEHIVRSYDVGLEGDAPYIVLEYVEGSTLKECIRAQGRLLPRAAVNLGAQVLEGLAHAHEKGFIHRDVKPQNIIVSPRGQAKLADFGIARNAEASTVTYSGAGVMGSVHYISPEQAKGRQATVESDIYSMGVTLYEMVTGRLPFEGENSVAVALKHIQEQIVPPILLQPDLPPSLNDVIMKALHKQPAARYHSARDMRTDLLRTLREPRGEFARQPAEAKKKPKKRTRRGLFRLAVAAILLVGLFGVMLFMEQTASQRTSATAELVPRLVGKTLEEANVLAKLRGYTAEVVETVTSDQYASGIVISQIPAEQTPLKSGGVIQLTVSGGAAMPQVPDLTGKTLEEARAALLEEGFKLGDVEYRISEAPVGTVYEQVPAPGASVLKGDEVALYISGEPSRSIEVPEVTKLPLASALSRLSERGFTSFTVRLAGLEQLETDAVEKQSPASGEIAQSTDSIELTVTGIGKDLYSASVAFTLDIAQDNTPLMAVVPVKSGNNAYKQVVYEGTLKKGAAQEFSFNAVIPEGGEHTLILYQNGQELRRTTAVFSYLG